MDKILPGLIALLGGLFAVVCAAADVPWFMNHYKARPIIAIVGRTGARIFYIVLGSGLMAIGGGLLLGFI